MDFICLDDKNIDLDNFEFNGVFIKYIELEKFEYVDGGFNEQDFVNKVVDSVNYNVLDLYFCIGYYLVLCIDGELKIFIYWLCVNVSWFNGLS